MADFSDPDQGKSYDPAEFIVAPSDARGVSYRLTFRLMPDMEKALEQILASKKFPFGTKGDIMRWCLREGIRALNRLEPVVTVTQRIDMLSALMAEETGHAEFLSAFGQIDAMVNKYLADQAPEQALRVIMTARHHIDKMPEGYWQDRYRKELETRYGKYSQMKGVPLTGHAPKGLGPSAPAPIDADDDES